MEEHKYSAIEVMAMGIYWFDGGTMKDWMEAPEGVKENYLLKALAGTMALLGYVKDIDVRKTLGDDVTFDHTVKYLNKIIAEWEKEKEEQK